MLNDLRNASESWGMRIFLGLIVIVFIVSWAAGDSISRMSTGASQTVATVGGEKIPLKNFLNDVKRRASQIKVKTGIDPDTRLIVETVLNEHIANKLIELEAEKMGLIVSNEQVRDAIRNDKNFQDSDGEFNTGFYKQFLRLTDYEEAEFINLMRNELCRQQFIRAIIAGLSVPDAMLQSFMMWKFENREVRIATLKYADIKDVGEITKEEIKAYYDVHHDAFTIPERRDFSVILLTTDQLKRNLKLTDEQVQAGFDDYFSSRKSGVPTNEESNRVIADLKSAVAEEKLLEISNKIQDDVAGGAKLEEVAKAYDLNLLKVRQFRRDTKNVDGLDAEHVLALTQDGFSATKGDTATTHETNSGGYMFIQLNEVYSPELQTLKAVEAQAAKNVRLEKQQQLAQEKANEIAQQVSLDKSLSNFTKTKSYTLDRDSSLKEIPLALRRNIFTAKLGEAIVGKAENGLLIAEVTKVIPAAKKTLQKNKDKFIIATRSLLTEDILSIFLAHLEAKYKIERNMPVINSVMTS